MRDEIFFDPEELEVAASWHDGQSSMLYAISSTGSLSRGTIRPRGDDGPLTDEEWLSYLASALEDEAVRAADLAGKQAKTARGKERKELLRERDILLGIADKAANPDQYE